MIILLSPAKIQNFKTPAVISTFTQPQFLKEAEILVKLMRELSMTEISKLLEINSSLTTVNFDRYFNWHRPFSLKNSKQAVFVFDGEVYRGLNPGTLSEADLEYAQSHLRLFSGLYGILRPLDLIQPYRLEVSSKLCNPNGKDLYAFWKEKVTKSVIKTLKTTEKPHVLLNLASSEYIKTLDVKLKDIFVLDIEFYEYKNDNLKQIVVYTKKARGLMARYVIQHKITDIEDLKGFSDAGYWFNPHLSTSSKFVFVR